MLGISNLCHCSLLIRLIIFTQTVEVGHRPMAQNNKEVFILKHVIIDRVEYRIFTILMIPSYPCNVFRPIARWDFFILA